MNDRVLIVDDEVNIARTLELILQAKEYEAKAAHSAEAALEIIAEWEPALAIVDVGLPKLNGIEFSKILRATYPRCRLLVFSGQIHTGELLEQAAKEGYQFEVLAKPVHPDVLLKTTAAVLSRPPDERLEHLRDRVEIYVQAA